MGVTENIQQQRDLYGEPLGDLVRRATAPLGLTQAATAKVLGLSPAMLSHLVTGHRVKIANPTAFGRLQALVDLGSNAGTLTTAEITEQLDAIAEMAADLTATRPTSTPTAPALVRAVLRAVASGRELEQAIDAVRDVAPGLAETLRVYGTGTPKEMRAHHAAIKHLLD